MVEKISKNLGKNVLQGESEFFDTLKLFSPGTAIRSALDDILKARMGALIVVDNEGLFNIVDGGFRLNSKFSSQKLVELAKMDGAIILSKDMKKILYANTLLSPNVRLQTKETGTRHKAAERTARQMNAISIAVSERKNKITIYYKNLKHELEKSSEILRRATETLQIMEKQKETLDDLFVSLNISEISDTTTISDICSVLQSIEVISRISDIVRRYLIELGREGIIVSMRLKELTKNLNKEKEMILQDYFYSDTKSINEEIKSINFDSLLETSNLPNLLFGESHSKSISPKGIRILSKINLNEKEKDSLLNNFKTLSEILNSDKETLEKIFQNAKEAKLFIQDLDNIREKILIGKRI